MTAKRETAIRLINDMVAGENAQDYDRMYSIYGPELVFYLNGDVGFAGKTSVMRDWERLNTPVIYGKTLREVQWMEANDSRVAFQYITEFDHLGEIFGVPAPGNRIQMHGLGIAEHDGEHVTVLRLFADVGDGIRQLAGKVRPPGTSSAAPQGPPIPEHERARYEEAGERLIRTVYASENEGDIEKQLACYADPLLDHFAGNVMTSSRALLRAALPAWWESLPGHHRDVEEVLVFGDRAVLRWHLTTDDIDGKPVSQHGASVIEHDGTQIRRFWAYYPDVAQVFPAIVDR
ncbi:MAG: nuclear transport factor 2 family protein [Dehalococcoidia bacterium]